MIQIIVTDPDLEHQDVIGRVLAPMAERIQAYLCKNGAEAFETSQSLENLHLVMTEFVLPDTDGTTLLAKLRRLHPTVKSVVFTLKDSPKEGAPPIDTIFLQKPILSESLQQALTDLLPNVFGYQASEIISQDKNVTKESNTGPQPFFTSPQTEQPLAAQQEAEKTNFQQTFSEKLPLKIDYDIESKMNPEQPVLSLHLGLKIADYTLVDKICDTDWGPCYQASQAGVNRPTKMIFYENKGCFTAQEFRDYFTQLAANPHPNLLTIIELGEYQGHPYVVEELWQGRSLSEFMTSQSQLNPRQAAHLGEQALGALAQLSQLPCRQITPDDMVVSNTGVLKICHIYPRPGSNPATSSIQLSALAKILRNCLSQSAREESRLIRLLDEMTNGSLSLQEAHKAFLNLQIELAPVNQIKETQEQKEIISLLEKEQKSRKLGQTVILISVVSLSLFIIAFLFRDQILGLISPGGIDFSNDMQRIPAGVVEMQMQDPENPNKTITFPINTGEYWIDTYETTIHEYSLFLSAVKRREVNPLDIMHPDTPERQRDFVPDDWANILKSATSNAYYRDIKLSPNSPIFNVSFYDAYAYAKWKGKRLPTAEEWLKAARGTQGYLYPWGDAPDDSAANTGLDYMAGRPEEGGKIDGFHGPAPVNDPRMDKDKSPFGVRLMFGNLSEWTSTPGGVALGQQRLRIMGNSYTSLKPNPLSHRSASPIIPSTRNALTGFRLVSDSPPQKKSD